MKEPVSPLDLGAPALKLPPEQWRALLKDPEVRLASRWEDPVRGLSGAVSEAGEVYAFPAPVRPRDVTMRQVARVLDGLPAWREARAWCVFLDDQRDPPRQPFGEVAPEPDWHVVRSGAEFRAFINSLTEHDVLVRVSWDQHLSHGDPDTGDSLLRWLMQTHPGRASLCRMDFHTSDFMARGRMQDLLASFLAAPSAAAGSPRLHLRAQLEEAGPMAARALREAVELAFFG
jgi:hypothetical protein